MVEDGADYEVSGVSRVCGAAGFSRSVWWSYYKHVEDGLWEIIGVGKGAAEVVGNIGGSFYKPPWGYPMAATPTRPLISQVI